MGEPTYRLLTGDDLWLPGDALNGSILGGAHGDHYLPVLHLQRMTNGPPQWCVEAAPTYRDPKVLRLDCRRPEVQARIADVLAGMGHDIDTLLSARRHGRLPNVEAAALVWCSALRVVLGLGPIVGGCSFDDGEEGDHHEALALAYAIREPGALLLPLPGGVVGRLEVSDAG